MNTVDDIKQRLDIAGVISEYVSLEKAGRNLRGLCPFHTEKTPSFFVFPERQSWRCFGCGAGGDVISFVMNREGLGFGDALRVLAQRAGVALPEKRREAARDERTDRFYAINEAAADYYHRLLETSEAAQVARGYVESRFLSPETVGEFRLGFSLNSWESLRQYLFQQGFTEAEAVAAGLLVDKEGRIYDRFRGRLMFPICDGKGRVIGFGARALDDSMPKYLNSSESPVFSKSSVLYGLDRARSAVREQGRVVIVEGYMDVLTAHQHGFRNVVASMGTALTENQIAILKGVTDHICFALDADAAGNAATLRGIEVCRNALAETVPGDRGWLGGGTQLGAEISIISMPEGRDPDEVIRENPEVWRELVDGARPLMEFIFEANAAHYDLSRPEGKSQLSEQLLPLISGMRDSAVREYYLTKLSGLTGLSDKVLAGKMAEQFRPVKTKKKPKDLPVQRTRAVSGTGDQLEEYCLSLLLKYPSLRGHQRDLRPDHFERSENREVFAAWQEKEDPGEMRDSIDPALHEHLEHLTEKDMPPIDKSGRRKALEDCIRQLDKRKLKSQIVFIAESALESGASPEESSARLGELQRRHSDLD